jgi:hypothetical protein
VAGNRRGGHHVERVHSRAARGGTHGDADRVVGLAQPACRQAVALGAEQQRDAAPAVGECLADRGRAVVGGEREDREAAVLELGEAVEPFGHPGVGDREHGAHRYLDRAPVQRVGAAGREQYGVHAERRGAAEDRADVAVVDEVFEDHDPVRVLDHVLDGWQWLAAERGERAAVHAVAGEPFGDLVGDYVHGHLTLAVIKAERGQVG